MLSAIWNVEMTHRSICLPDFGSFAGSAILPPGLIEVRNKSVTFDGCQLK